MAKKFNLRKDQRNRKDIKKKKNKCQHNGNQCKMEEKIHYSLPGGNTAKCIINLKNAYVDQPLNSTQNYSKETITNVL